MKHLRPIAAIIMFVMAVNEAQAYLRPFPEISAVALAPKNPDVIYLRLRHLPFEAAVSTNGGLTFKVIGEGEIPKNASTKLTVGTRRYVLFNTAQLLRSDDGGATWTKTSATDFLRELCTAEAAKAEKDYRIKCGARLPERSELWLPAFGLYAVTYFFLAIFLLRQHGWFKAALTGIQGLVVILLLWSLLWGFHAVITNWTSPYAIQSAYWNTSVSMWPSPKLGLAMSIAARPLPLITYLLALWPILPGSLDILSGSGRALTPIRNKLALALCITAGVLFVGFHVSMMFIGYFWE